MILSVSRRTDIPAFYANWFINRIREGFVMVRNPMNYHQVSKISLDSSLLDCIVFWTKNAGPLLPYIDEIAEKYNFYFQYTLNAYEKDIEPFTFNLKEKIEVFQTLSKKIGAEKIIWRYDPVLINNKYSVLWHMEQFANITKQLHPYVKQCVFSFVDLYDKTKVNLKDVNLISITRQDMILLAKNFAAIANKYNLEIKTCAEEINLEEYGIKHGSCINLELISRIAHRSLTAKKDKNQRNVCGCAESIDIGQYNTCKHGCKYCYANFNPQSVITFCKQHNVKSPLLIGDIGPEDKITERKIKSFKDKQGSFLF